MTLLNSIQIKLNSAHLDKLKQIDTFDFSKTAKKVSHDLGGLTDQYLLDGIENLKRYYAVALLDPLNEHAVSRYVDPFWHAHILHTKDYMEFCDSIFGQYIHHAPLNFDDPNEAQVIAMLYSYTKETYNKIFTSLNEQWWPDLEQTAPRHALGPLVCRHMTITNEQIRNMGLFPYKKMLSAA